MNEADQLRQAMRATERTERNPLDLAVIMREGRRLRRRRRLASASAAALSVALVVVGIAVGVQRSRPPAPERPPLPATAAHPTATPTPNPPEPQPVPIGDVVDSGIRHGSDERVFYFVPVDLPQVPRVTIGLVAGRRAASGELISDYLANDVEGSDRRPGFHQIGYDESRGAPNPAPVPAFGYFVGPATRIVGRVDGRQIEARLARWSKDPQVVIFWFDPEALAPGVRLDGITARDEQGRKL